MNQATVAIIRDIVTTITAVVSTIAALITSCITTFTAMIIAGVAVVGLQTWRKQLKGTSQYDIARKLLHSVYEYRDSIAAYRSPFMSGGEIATAIKQANIDLDPKDTKYNYESQIVTYTARWAKVNDANIRIYTDGLEAEVVLHKDIRKYINTFRMLSNKLNFATQTLLEAMNPKPSQYQKVLNKNVPKLEATEMIVYEFFPFAGESENEFTIDINNAISDIENALQPYLNM